MEVRNGLEKYICVALISSYKLKLVSCELYAKLGNLL